MESTATLEAQITELAGHLNSANHRLLTLIAEFDRRKGWSDSATQSCAHWLNWKCGIDIGAARELFSARGRRKSSHAKPSTWTTTLP